PLPHKQQKHLQRISASAKHLLALLGINDAKSIAHGIDQLGKIDSTARIHPTTIVLLTWLYDVGVNRRPAKATIGADERLTTLLLLLSDFAEAAERCALETGNRYRHGRGGKRRAGQVTAEVELIQAIIAIYA